MARFLPLDFSLQDIIIVSRYLPVVVQKAEAITLAKAHGKKGNRRGGRVGQNSRNHCFIFSYTNISPETNHLAVFSELTNSGTSVKHVKVSEISLTLGLDVSAPQTRSFLVG